MEDHFETDATTTRKSMVGDVDGLIENFKARVKTANRIGLILCTILLSLWLSGLEPKADTIGSYVFVKTLRINIEKVRNQSQGLSNDPQAPSAVIQQELKPTSETIIGADAPRISQLTIPDIISRNSVIPASEEASQDRADSRGRRLLELKQTKQRDAERLKVIKELEVDARRQAKVPYEFPGGLKFPIPIEVVAVLWLLLSLLSLVYMQTQRSKLLSLGSRIARRISQTSEDSAWRQEILADAPWWIAPIPSKKGEVVSQSDLKEVIGWPNDLQNSILLATCYVILIIAQVRVWMITYIFVNLDEQPRNDWIDWVAPTVASMILLCSISLVCISYAKREVPDREPSFRTSTALPRRQLLFLGGLGFMSALAGSALNRWIDKEKNVRVLVLKNLVFKNSSLYSPRFPNKDNHRRKQQLNHSSNGLYENTKSKVVHFVDNQGKIYAYPGINELNLKEAPKLSAASSAAVVSQYLARLEKTRFVWSAESFALSLIEKGETIPAVLVLRLAIRHAYENNKGKSAIRLGDLLAGVLAKNKLVTLLGEMTTSNSFICAAFLADNQIKNTRIPKWSNQQGKWYQELSGSSDVLR
jgi:hypothetical protein